MSAHTPTPWRVFTTPDGRKLVGIGGMDGEGVLDAGFGVWSWMDAEGIANAELVVSAVNSHHRLREAMQEACDLLAERKQGSPARSAGHNARLRLEAALKD